MSKTEADYCNSLDIFWLKKHGYLEGGYKWGGIKWVRGMSGNESSIGFAVNLGNDFGNHIRLQYTHTSSSMDEKENVDYRVELATTSCNFGGVRYWFICPLYKNGQYCGKRVGVLYNLGKHFGCRHCGELTYDSRNSKYGKVISFPELERLEKEVKREYYAGKMTRKYRRLLHKKDKSDLQLMRFATGMKGSKGLLDK